MIPSVDNVVIYRINF